TAARFTRAPIFRRKNGGCCAAAPSKASRCMNRARPEGKNRARGATMSRSGVSTLCIIGSIVLSLAWMENAGGQGAPTPDLSGGEGGWVHPRGPGFQPVPGSPSPAGQDPRHPFTPGQGTAWRIGDLSNPNLKPWVKELMKKDTDEIDAGKIAFQPGS